MTTRLSAGRVRKIYQFIKENSSEHSVETMCQLLEVSRSGYYAWHAKPMSDQAREDARLLRLIRASFKASHGIYGAPRIFLDLREAGEVCSKHRVARLMRVNNIKALHGYRTQRYVVSKPAALTPNLLKRVFTVSKPNTAWVTDITYVRTWEGWLYLAVVMDLFSRKVIGWSVRPTIVKELVLDAVLMAVRRRKPKAALIHSDQGSQGEFNRSSQHFNNEGCDDEWKTTIRSIGTCKVVFTGSANSGTACEATEVLGSDCCGARKRGSGGDRSGIAAGGGAMVSARWRPATIAPHTIGAAARGPLLVIRGA